MNVNQVGPNTPVQNLTNNPIQKAIPADSAQPKLPATDRLQLSGASHLLASLKSNNGVRIDKVSQIKAQIANGSYDNDERLNGAVDKLLDELQK